ncbi:MAG: response regulator [Ignavibacteriaceae bacterium]|jgi:DNA-binding NtrC family response regulator|nr:response regulator [Ignavibacteriaceae bacterium]MCW8814249.1 response regulator [Chlorobium sp.]
MTNNLKILILDDEEIVVTRLKAALEKEGYVVETFIDSRDAKKRIDENKFDIVVTDLKMANIDGMQLFQFVKEKYPATEVILISGFATLKVVKDALQAGVRDVIAKPFKISQIKELINKIANDIRN